MEFVVLARKLRPSRFEHLIGQETVVRALRNAILTDRVAHAFLFTGSRGVGKTSTARILTKALNCEQPADGEPCNACSNCTEITANASPDVYEIDAASNRGIDNIRELRENTKYAPVKSRYKTYIIDEAHMLTKESFNALLKTLEEPPPHVKFILATTRPHEIPDTILSRCQRYDFARIPVRMLTDYLVQVTEREGIALSRTALEVIARNAAGGVRDALTAVDQVVSYAGADVADAQVLSILGLADHREIFALLGAVLDKQLPAALDAFATARARGHDLGVVLESLIREVKDFSLYLSLSGAPAGSAAHTGGGGAGSRADGQSAAAAAFAEHPPETLAFYAERRGQVTLDVLQQLFYLLLEVEEQLKRSDFAQACFEMGLVKACHIEPLVAVPDLLAQVRALSQGMAPRERPSAPVAPAGRGTVGGPPPPSPAARIAAQVQSRGRESGGTPGAPRRSVDDGDEAEPAGPTPSSEAQAAPRDAVPPDRPEPPERPELPEPPDRPEPPERPELPEPHRPQPPADDPSGGVPPSESPFAPSSDERGPPSPPAAEASGPLPVPPPAPVPRAAHPAPSAAPSAARSSAPSAAPLAAASVPAPMPWERRRRPSGSAPAPAPQPAGSASAVQSAPDGQVAGSPAAPPPDPQRLAPSVAAPSVTAPSVAEAGALGDVPPDEGPGLCDDPRWRGFVEALGEQQRRLASKLRRAEVVGIGTEGGTDAGMAAAGGPGSANAPDLVWVVPADAANRPTAEELEAALPHLRTAFGDAFQLAFIDDTTRKAREALTIAGRNRILTAARIAARRKAAVDDPQVQRLLRSFPGGSVVDVALSEDLRDAPNPKRSDDV